MALHEHEPPTDAGLVRRLLAAQHPAWADLPLRRVRSDGTTNAVYRLGDSMSVRLPLVAYGERAIDTERVWLPRLAPLLPLEIPAFLAEGAPGAGYPFRWCVHGWVEGDVATRETIDDPAAAARELAEWITALRAIDATGGPDAAEHGLRGAPLATRDDAVARGMDALSGEIDTAAAKRIWESARAARPWEGAPAWCHGDLLAGNLLARDGRLAAVLDFAGLGVGDPACDLMVAWALFDGASRDAFRETLGADDAQWARGRGHALYHALIYIPYYRDTNPAGTAAVRRMLAAVLSAAQ